MPSAFEGALWTCMGIKGADTIFHSPPGCYMNQHVNALVNDWTCELYSTNLSYANIMQGAEDRMETTLEKIAAKKPGAVLIVTAPTVEVTRDDVEGVAKKVGFKDTLIIHPPIGGYRPRRHQACAQSLRRNRRTVQRAARQISQCCYPSA